MSVKFNPDILGDEDVQKVLTTIDTKLCRLADFIKGEALNFDALDVQREFVEQAKKALGVKELSVDWREVVAEAAILSGCLRFLLDVKPDYLEQTIKATRFPPEIATFILHAAVTARLGDPREQSE